MENDSKRERILVSVYTSQMVKDQLKIISLVENKTVNDVVVGFISSGIKSWISKNRKQVEVFGEVLDSMISGK